MLPPYMVPDVILPVDDLARGDGGRSTTSQRSNWWSRFTAHAAGPS